MTEKVSWNMVEWCWLEPLYQQKKDPVYCIEKSLNDFKYKLLKVFWEGYLIVIKICATGQPVTKIAGMGVILLLSHCITQSK